MQRFVRNALAFGLFTLEVAAVVGCATGESAGPNAPAAAVTKLAPASGSYVSGTVHFEPVGDHGVHIKADLKGLAPGEHGFHIHETGDCSAADASSAGDHFAGTPTTGHPELGGTHGTPGASARHTGDLGNITANEKGEAHVDLIDDAIALNGDHSIVGRALIVHEKRDDGTDVKSAGARVACGVIGN